MSAVRKPTPANAASWLMSGDELSDPLSPLRLSSPLQHHELLLSEQQEHIVAWLKGRRVEGQREWYPLDRMRAADMLSRWFDEPDVYLTPNEFIGWRRIVLLSALNALYLDFDEHAKSLLQAEIRAWAERTLRQIDTLGWPMPTAVIFTGRGFHLYWRHTRMPKQALPRWQSLVRHMRQTLKSDPMSADSCRVLRVLGTTHSALPGFRVHGELIAGQQYDFEHLYETILRPQKAAIRDLRAAQARRDGEASASGKKRPYNPKSATGIYRYYYDMHQDLWVLARHVSQHGIGVPEGKRVRFLELLCASLAWFTRAEALSDEIIVCSRALMPTLTDEEALASTKTMRARADQAALGEKQSFDGRLVDPRYKYSRQKLWEKVGEFVQLQPEMIERLRVIVPPDVAAERRTATQQARDRTAEGRYEDRNTGQGVRAGNQDQRATAREMRAAGRSLRAIAAALEVSVNTVQRWTA